MVYKKYIVKNGKTYGPYVYHSHRVNGKVVSEYHGNSSFKKRKIFLLAGFFVLFLVAVFCVFQCIPKESSFQTENSMNSYNGVSDSVKITPQDTMKKFGSFVLKIIGFATEGEESSESSDTGSQESSSENSDSNDKQEKQEDKQEEKEQKQEEKEQKQEEKQNEEQPPAEETPEEIPAEEPEVEENETEETEPEEIPATNETEIPTEELNETQEVINETISNETEVNITIPVINETQINETQTEINETIVSNITEINETISNETLYNITALQTNETLKQFKAVIGKPVKWIKTITINSSDSLIELPKDAINITIKTGDEVQQALEQIDEYETLVKSIDKQELISGITGFVSQDLENSKGVFERFLVWLKSLSLTGKAISEEEIANGISETSDSKIVDVSSAISGNETQEIAIEYYTEAPQAIEIEKSNGKEITISAKDELNYTEILAYSLINESFGIVDKNTIKLYWIKQELSNNVGNDIENLSYKKDNIALISRDEKLVASKIMQIFADYNESSNTNYLNFSTSNNNAESAPVASMVMHSPEKRGLRGLPGSIPGWGDSAFLTTNAVSEDNYVLVKEEANFTAYDLDSNGILDYIEWIIPHLSNQTYEIIIEISDAQHLDENRTFIENIYDKVSARDYDYSVIPDGHYARVSFEHNLTKVNDITIYAKSDSSANVEVYEKDGTDKIAEFTNINLDNMYKIYLTNMSSEYQDTFDLRSLGDVEYDYVVDPATTITLTNKDIFADVYVNKLAGMFTGLLASLIRINITAIPAGSDISDAVFCAYIAQLNDPGALDNDISVSYINNETWGETISAAEVDAMTPLNNTNTTMTSITLNEWACFNVTQQVQEAVLNGNGNITLRFEDKDYLAKSPLDGVTDNSGLNIGDAVPPSLNIEFEDREGTDGTGKLPYLNVTYTAGTTFPLINFTDPTLPNNTQTANTSIVINVSIVEQTNKIDSIIYNWNGTNFTMYNDSLVLMYNFENLSVLGENATKIVDIGRYSYNATPFGDSANWSSYGKYGGSYYFGGDGNTANTTSLKLGANNFTIIFWVNGINWGATSHGGFISTAIAGAPGIMLRYDGLYMSNDGATWAVDAASWNSGMTLNTWHQVIMQRYEEEINIYVDLNKTLTTVFSGSLNSEDTLVINTDTFGLGNSMYFDELMVYNRTLTSAEINHSYYSNLNKFNSTQWYLYVNQSFNATTGLGSGNYSYQAMVSDVLNNWNYTEVRKIEVTAEATDSGAPLVTSLTESPTDPATYSTSGKYEFNITVTDASSISIAKLEFNGINYTASNKSNIYNVTLPINLGGDVYNYTWYVNDTFGNKNDSQNGSYTVSPTSQSITPLLNGSNANLSIVFGNNINASFNGVNITTLLIKINESVVNAGANYAWGAGVWQINYSISATQNYTGFHDILKLEINKTSSLLNLTLNNSQSNKTLLQNTTIDLNCSLITGDAGTVITLYNNETLINNKTSPLYNSTNFTILGMQNISCIYLGSQNYTAYSENYWVNSTGSLCTGFWGAWSDWSGCDVGSQSRTRTDSGGCSQTETQSCSIGGTGGSTTGTITEPEVICTPKCAERTCGDDGCGGSCGSCKLGFTVCRNGQCVLPCIDGCVRGEERRECVSENSYKLARCEMTPKGCLGFFRDIQVVCEEPEVCLDGSCVDCVENWVCQDWGVCSDGLQTRTCSDLNECGTSITKPNLTQSCISGVEVEYFSYEPNLLIVAGDTVGFGIKAFDSANLAEILVKWYIDGELVKTESGTGSITSSLNKGFKDKSKILVYILANNQVQQVSWEVKINESAKIDCEPNWNCKWSDCLEGDSVSSPYDCEDINSCGVTTGKSDPKECACFTKWECGDWGECSAKYDINDVLEGSSFVQGVQKRTCVDTYKCKPEKIEEIACELKVPIIAEKTQWCEEEYVNIYDEKKENLLSRTKRSELFKEANLDRLDVSLVTTNFVGYCDYCFDGVKDFDEQDIDCGGKSCPSCLDAKVFSNWLPTTIYSSWSMFVLFLVFVLIFEFKNVIIAGENTSYLLRGLVSNAKFGSPQEKILEQSLVNFFRHKEKEKINLQVSYISRESKRKSEWWASSKSKLNSFKNNLRNDYSNLVSFINRKVTFTLDSLKKGEEAIVCSVDNKKRAVLQKISNVKEAIIGKINRFFYYNFTKKGRYEKLFNEAKQDLEQKKQEAKKELESIKRF